MKVGQDTVEFLLQEEDTVYDDEKDTFEAATNEAFFRAKLFRLLFRSDSQVNWSQNVSFFNDILMVAVGEAGIERFVSCMECKRENSSGYFLANTGFMPENSLDKCSNGEHDWDSKLIQNVETQILQTRTSPLTPSEALSVRDDHQGSESELGWKFAIVIANDNYTDDSGYKRLPSVKEDFKNIVRCLKDELGTTSI